MAIFMASRPYLSPRASKLSKPSQLLGEIDVLVETIRMHPRDGYRMAVAPTVVGLFGFVEPTREGPKVFLRVDYPALDARRRACWVDHGFMQIERLCPI
jgi:hypothetical protein